MLKLDCCFTTDVGRIRSNNEDNFYLNGSYKAQTELEQCRETGWFDAEGVFAVCDGMGGEENGEKASLLAVETLAQYQGQDFNDCADEYIEQANGKICEMMTENGGSRSGTTLALINIADNKATSHNIGDSRVYLYRQGELTQLSEDHNQAAWMVRMGVLTKEQAATHKDRHVLNRYLGIYPEEMIIQAYKSEEIPLEAGDIFLLCSDGLTDMVSEERIAEILGDEGDAGEYADTLKDQAIENGGRDNVTVGIIRVVEKESFGERLRRRVQWILHTIKNMSR